MSTTSKIITGDCREVMATFDDNSVDAIVTDPPYGLSREPDAAEVLRHWLAGDDYKHKGGGFMGKSWDSFVPGPAVWKEALRVLKPGGHLLAFFGTRTYDLGTMAIRLAGFEIRDSILWLYGSGFPKSLDVSKAIDKVRIEDLEPVRVICRVIRTAMDAQGLKSRHLVAHFNGCDPRLIDHWAARDSDSQPGLPTWDQWGKLREVLSIGPEHDAEVWRLNGRKGQPSDVWRCAKIIGEYEGMPGGFGEHRFNVRDNKIRGATDAARQWQGWGTALKPAHEPICVARKPLEGTVAANVLKWGTGALNIDGSRICGAGGRWPANIIHDGSPEVVAGFPVTTSGAMKHEVDAYCGKSATGFLQGRSGPSNQHGDTGSAARFFYCAKASRKDRDGSSHPTMKPTDLMRYLCRLVTPLGGIVLDPFCGSGSTGKAAIREGFRFIGIELSEEYAAIARARIGSVDEKKIEPAETKEECAGQLSLF